MSRGEIRACLGDRRLADLKAEAARLEISEQELVRRAVDVLLGRQVAAEAPPKRPQGATETPPSPTDDIHENAPKVPPERPRNATRTPPTGDIGGLSVSSGEGGGSLETVPSSQKKEGSGEARRRAAEGFPEFWEVYPRKEGKKKAEEAWVKTFKRRPPLPDLLSALRKQAAARGWPTQYTPHASTWLNGDKWDDPPDPPPPNGNGYHPPLPERPGLDPFWRAFLDSPAGEERTARFARALELYGSTLTPEQRAEVERLDRETP